MPKPAEQVEQRVAAVRPEAAVVVAAAVQVVLLELVAVEAAVGMLDTAVAAAMSSPQYLQEVGRQVQQVASSAERQQY